MGRLTLALGSFLIPTVLGMYTAYHPWVSPLAYQLPGPLTLQHPLNPSFLRSGQIPTNNGWDTNIMGNRQDHNRINFEIIFDVQEARVLFSTHVHGQQVSYYYVLENCNLHI